jgi:hypothetical protein
LGARTVTLTDGGPNALLSLAASNIDANRHLWPARSDDRGETAVEVVAHVWGASADGVPTLCGHDWVLGSDVTYAASGHVPLCETLAKQLSVHSRGAAVVLAHERRVARNEAAGDAPPLEDEKLASFVAAAGERGLRVSTLHVARVDTGEGEDGGERTVLLLRVELDDGAA